MIRAKGAEFVRGSIGSGRTLRLASSWSRLTLSTVALLVIACQGLRTHSHPDAPTWKHQAGWNLALEFQKDLTAASRRDGEPYERGRPEIDVGGKRVFVGSSDGGLYALHAKSGDTLWRFETKSFVQSHPLYEPEEDVVYFGSHDGALYKVDAKTGKLHWRLSTNAEVARQPIVSSGLVYFANANDTLIAADVKTGRIVWSQHRAPAMGMEVAGYSGPSLSGGLVYMGFSDGVATAFDALTGEERWRPVDLSADAEDVLGELPKYLDVDTTPVLAELAVGPAAIFGHYQGGVSALDAEIGTLLWSNTEVVGVSDLMWIEEPARVFQGEERPGRTLLLVSTGTSGLWALDPETGQEVWRRALPRGGISQPTFASGLILVGSSQLGLYAISPVDGSLVDGIHFDLGISAAPAAEGRRAYVMTNGGNFLAFSLAVPGLSGEQPNYRGPTSL